MFSHVRREWRVYLKIPALTLFGIIALLLGLALLTVAVARVGNAETSFFGRKTGEPSRIVVLVHGTFAPNADWTEPHALLVRAIEATTPTNDILFVRFRWPGAIDGYQNNTNFVRYGAGQKLTDLLWQLRKQYKQAGIFIVAHKRVLLAGDAEGGERELPSRPPKPDSIEGQLVACCSTDLKSDVLVVGHHGSLTSSRTAFLDAVGAKIYAISSGPYPYKRVRLPDEEVVAELERRGQVLRTDQNDLFRTEDETHACEANPHKIGPDTDETPGGCDNIVIDARSGSPITATYSSIAD